MACNLPNVDFAELPSKFAVEIDFSHIRADGKPRLGPGDNPLNNRRLKQIAPQYTAIVTLWAPASVLLERFTGRKQNHPKKRQVEELYSDPSRLNEFYRAWMECVDAFLPDDHWVFDTKENQFEGPDWLKETIEADKS